jgi:hypothetical protein
MNNISQKYKSPEYTIISNLQSLLNSIAKILKDSFFSSPTSRIRELPSFFEPTEYLPEITPELQRTFLRMYKRANDKMNTYKQNIIEDSSLIG